MELRWEIWGRYGEIGEIWEMFGRAHTCTRAFFAAAFVDVRPLRIAWSKVCPRWTQ